jgi:hypothetical protein
MACNSFAQRSLREKSCREPQFLTNQIGNPLPDYDRRGVGLSGNHGRHDRSVGNAQPGDPVNAQVGIDNGRGVAEKKFKAANRKLKALFSPPDVNDAEIKVDLVSAQAHELGNPQAVRVAHHEHGGVVLPVAAAFFCYLDQGIDLALTQVFAWLAILIFDPRGRNCPIYGSWGDNFQSSLGHLFPFPCLNPADLLHNKLSH